MRKTSSRQPYEQSPNQNRSRPKPVRPIRTNLSGRQSRFEPYLDLIGEAMTETLWPTRCCLCDRPGRPLCETCQRNLPFIDALWACPSCGAAFGKLVCTECNHYTLSHKGRGVLLLDGCQSCVRATANALRVVSTYKDKGDQSLAGPLARMLSWIMPPAWHDFFLVPIPARPTALRKRGFDHIELVTEQLARMTGMHRQNILASKDRKDQRDLGATGRAKNAQGAFGLLGPKAPPKNVVLIDDVMTTGSTLTEAASVLKEAGTRTVTALTFARV